MLSALLTLGGVAAFVLVCGGITAVIVVAALVGLQVLRVQRRAARRLAADEGWQFVGHDRFSGRVGPSDWHGGAHQDEDSGRRWTEFSGGVPGVAPGGFMIVPRQTWLGEQGDDGRDHWTVQAVGGAAFAQRWTMLASHPRWAAVWQPTVEALWLRAAALRDGELQAHAQQLVLHMRREDGLAEPTLEQVAALLRVGQALMQATQAVAGAADALTGSHGRGG